MHFVYVGVDAAKEEHMAEINPNHNLFPFKSVLPVILPFLTPTMVAETLYFDNTSQIQTMPIFIVKLHIYIYINIINYNLYTCFILILIKVL